jgi:hypothetical protein
MRAKLFAAASVAALCAFAFTPAMAAAPGGYIDGGYAYTNASGSGSSHLNDWNVTGAVNVPFGASAFSGQLDANYHGISSSGSSSVHTDAGELSVMWTAPMGRIGATAGATEIGGSGSSSHLNNYGGFGVLYPNAQWTIGAKGASVTCSGCSSATVWGGRVMGYPTSNVALNVDYDSLQLSGSNVHTWSAGGEWQPTPQPWTVRLGYANSSSSGGSGHLNSYSINFRWYFGGAGTLVQHHRDGAEPWGTKIDPFKFIW